jgi:ABC-type multidrug transport system fused ATPase/permease subunit
VRVAFAEYGGLLRSYLRPHRGEVAALGGLLGASVGLQLAGPQVLRAFIDAATGAAAGADLRLMAALFVGLALVQQGVAVLATYVGERLGWSTTNALREDLTRHCLGLDLGFHKARTPGELIERIDGDVTALASFFSQFVVQVVGNVLLLLGVIVLVWVVDWRVGAGLVGFAVVSLLVMGRMRGITVPYWRRARQASAALYGFLEERLGGTEDVRANGAGAYVMRRLHQPLRERILTNCRARVIGAVQWSAPDVLSSFQTAAGFALVFLLFRGGGITLGTAFMITYYLALAFRPLRVITNQMEDLQKAGAGVVRIGELLAVQSALRDPARPAPLADGALAVAFDGVSFAYEGGAGDPDLALRGVSFRLAPGEVLGLIGRTGSGKTTVSRLLFRLYDPTEGAVRLGGVDLREARIRDVRHRVGLVTQDVQLFRATVRDNVTFFDPAVDDGEILAALERLGLTPWLETLPEGLDTVLGAGGRGVSAGEAQLLAFARVFLQGPGLVILDEASSRLDPATERLIERAVGRLLAGRTAIVIAHRLATVERADTVLVLEGGRVAEWGPRAALAADPGSRLAALLRTGLEAGALGVGPGDEPDGGRGREGAAVAVSG